MEGGREGGRDRPHWTVSMWEACRPGGACAFPDPRKKKRRETERVCVASTPQTREHTTADLPRGKSRLYVPAFPRSWFTAYTPISLRLAQGGKAFAKEPIPTPGI